MRQQASCLANAAKRKSFCSSLSRQSELHRTTTMLVGHGIARGLQIDFLNSLLSLSCRSANQEAERFRRVVFSLIHTGAWSLDFSQPLT